MPTTILGLSGSLRQASTNTALLRSFGDALADDVDFELYDYREVPLFNSDQDTPASVLGLKEAITRASAVVIATPEYNHSIPGVLKNAIDWASRPAFKSPFAGKPVGVLSAAASFVGGARAQMHLKTILMGMNATVYSGPELLVGQSMNCVERGRISDPDSLRRIQRNADAFTAWALNRS
jgi:chromate reductase